MLSRFHGSLTRLSKGLHGATLFRLTALLMAAGIIVGLVFAVVPAQPAFAASITVDRTDDTAAASACTAAANDCSLRGAVIFANANPGTTISIPAGTYNLTIDGTGESYPANPNVGDLDVEGNNTIITGAGSANTIINQTTPNDRVIEVNPALVANFNFTMSGVTIQGGRETTGVGGGGMISGSQGNTVTLSDIIFNNNQATGGGSPIGGGLAHSGGSLSCTNCTFSNNSSTGSGGGLYLSANYTGCVNPCAGTFTIVNSTFTGNTSTNGNGGGLITTSGSAYTISGSTFTGNSAGGSNGMGGGIFNESGSLTVSQSVFLNNLVSNASGGRGGAIGSADGAGHNVAVNFSRFVGNSAATTANGNTLYGGTGSTMTATDNWWGSNTGPGTNDIAGTATSSPWIILANTANPNPIQVNQSTTLTADFLHNSSAPPPAAASFTPAQISVLIGLPVTWANVQHGTLSNQQLTVQGNGTATATFTAGSTSADCGAVGSAEAKVDNVANGDSLATAQITINCPDLTASKADDVGGTTQLTNNGASWTWTITVSNNGSADATFANGQTILTDNLPNTSISYGSVTVTPVSGISGTIACSINGSDDLICTASGSVQIIASGSFTASFLSTASVSGTYTNPRSSGICAVDPNNNIPETNESNNSCNPDSVTVTGLATTTTISSDNPDPSVVGQPVIVQYSVTSSGGTPTGNVTVSDGTITCSGTVAAGQCSLTFTSAGAKSLTATYAGDGTFNGSTSAVEAHQVNPADTTTTITSDLPDPSAGGQAVIVKYQVSVNPPGAGAPTGNVIVTDGVDTCTGTVAAGQCSISLNTGGVRTLTATYNGDSNFNASTSAGVTHTVDNIPPSVTINQAATQPDPTSAGPVHFTAVFSELVTGFGDNAGDVALSGTAGATTAVVTQIAPNDGTTYDVAVSGMSVNGTVIASIPANVAQDDVGNGNTASTSTDNTVTFNFDTTPPDTTINSGPANPTNSTSASFTFSGTDNITPPSSLTFQCQLDGGGFSACVSPQSYTGLALGSHTFMVRAIDAANNVDPTPASFTWEIHATTTLLYNGVQIVNIGSSFQPAAKLSSAASACVSGQQISFSLDRNPLDGSAGPYPLGTAATNTSGQATLSAVSTTNWLEGAYDIHASFAGTSSCAPSFDDATLTAAKPGNAATGGGWYTLSGSGRINFGFTVRKTDPTCTVNCTYKGQLLLINNGKWRLKGTLSNYVKLSTGQGAASGVGDLYWWNASLNGGLGDWVLAQSGVSFTINFFDSGTSGKSSTDAFGIKIQYTPVPPQPATLPNSTLIQIKGGNIIVS